MAPYTLSPGGWTVIKVTVILGILDLIFLILRFVSRRKVKASFGSDDVWAILAYIFFLSNVAMDYWSIFLGGVGYPPSEYTYDQTVVNLKADYVSSWLNLLNVLCVKLCVLCLYRRIFETPRFRKFSFWFGVVVTAIMVLMMVASAVRCLPVESIWNPNVKSTTCLNYSVGFLTGFTLNTITDVILLSMPFVMIKTLQMPIQRKLELAGIFLLGIGTCIASVLRITSTYSKDPVEDNRINLIVWSNIEPSVGLICACLPTLRPLFPVLTVRRVRDWYSRKLSSASNSDNSDEGASNGSFDDKTTSFQVHGLPQVYIPEHHEALAGSKYKFLTEVSSSGRSNKLGERPNWGGIEVERAVDVV